MSRKYSPNHPAVRSQLDTYFTSYTTTKELNRPYRLPLTGLVVNIIGGLVAMSCLPIIGVFGFPFAMLWAAPFLLGGVACFSRCLTLLEEEKKRG